MLCQDTGGLEAVHIPKDVIELAKEIQPWCDALRQSHAGNGEIVVKVEMSGGTLRRSIQIFGKLFHRGKH